MTKISSVSSASKKDSRSRVGQVLRTPVIDSSSAGGGGHIRKISSVSSANKKDSRSRVGQVLRTPVMNSLSTQNSLFS